MQRLHNTIDPHGYVADQDFELVYTTLLSMPPGEHTIKSIEDAYKSHFGAAIHRTRINGAINRLEAAGFVTFRRERENGKKYIKLVEK